MFSRQMDPKKSRWREIAHPLLGKSGKTLLETMADSDDVALVQMAYAVALERDLKTGGQAHEIYGERKKRGEVPPLSWQELHALRGVVREMTFPPEPTSRRNAVYMVAVPLLAFGFLVASVDLFTNEVSHGMQTEANPLVGAGFLALGISVAILLVGFKFKRAILSGQCLQRWLGIYGVNVDALPDPGGHVPDQVTPS